MRREGVALLGPDPAFAAAAIRPVFGPVLLYCTVWVSFFKLTTRRFRVPLWFIDNLFELARIYFLAS
jgi:hypothetical protein